MTVKRSIFSRRAAAGAAMLGFVAALEIEDLVDPVNVGSTAQRLQSVADHPTRLVAAAALLLASSALLLSTLASLRSLVRGRAKGHRLMAAAAAVWTLGALGHAAVVGYYVVLASAAHHRSATVLATLDGTTRGAAGAIIGVGVGCFALGCVLTIAALVRSGIASRWVLLAIVAAVVGQPAGRALGVRAFDLGQLAAVAPLVWVGWRLVSGASRLPSPAAARFEPALEA